MKESSCKSLLMVAYYQEVWKLEDKFRGIEQHHILLKDNHAIDSLAKMAIGQEPVLEGVFVNDLHELSTRIRENLTQAQAGPSQPLGGSGTTPLPNPDQALGGSDRDVAVMALDPTDWRRPLLAYILDEVLSPEMIEARWVAQHAKTFIAIGDELYKQSPSRVLMKCILTDQGKHFLLEVHAGIADTTLPHDHWSGRPFVMDSTSPRH
ncbi:uncharacterized protein LOC101761011 [Setaria italica]|uniref:uncharacterized protein LOC101761011 n=1 Tax=Setaria italica TaxID=4555 RepID=UPI0003511613|nr:uncharacterized protein LOC101761011 [Setaria italica]